MSVLKLIAIVGILLGGVSFVIGLKEKSKKSIGLFVALVIASAALFVVAGIAENKLIQNLKPQEAVAQTEQPAVAADTAEAAQDNDFTDDADIIAAAPEAQPETAAAPEVAPDAQPEAAAAPEVAADAQPEAAPEVAADAQPEAAPEVAAAPEVQAAPVAAPAEPGKAPEFKNDALAPLANAGSHIKDAKINEVISFSMKSTKKNPNGGAIVGGSWDFGDGSTADTGDAKHAYAQQGTYYAVLTVKDDAGRTAKAVRTIEVYRPENKIKFTTKSLEDLKAVTATAPTISDKFEKTFSGSQVTMEASGYMLAADHCKCELIVNLKGPGCTVKRAKSVSDGGEGDLSVKAQCKGELGEYTWSVERKVTSNCQCTFQNIKLEGFES